jgi:hypothetical protein
VRRQALLTVALLLGACGGEKDGSSPDVPTEAALPPQTPVDRELSEVPPKDRRAFQRALACEVGRSETGSIDVTPEYIDGLRDRLAEDPSIAEC